jgi:hypothetical protein
MRKKVILLIIGVWLLGCIIAGINVLSQFMTVGNGDALYIKIAISGVIMLWFWVLTFVFLRSLNDQFPVKLFKCVSAGWFIMFLVLHFLYTQQTLKHVYQFSLGIPNAYTAHLLSFVVGLLGAIPFVLLTLISKEGR